MSRKHTSFWATCAGWALWGVIVGLTIAQFLVVDESLSNTICQITIGVLVIDFGVFAVWAWRFHHDN